MRNAWGRPPKNDLWSDIQALAIWVFIIGIVGYLLFPGFFNNVYTALTDPYQEAENIGEITLPTSSLDLSNPNESYQLPDFYNSLQIGDSEISEGYWAIFVGDNQFQQLPLTTESYAFLLKLIEKDGQTETENTLLLAINGNIHKHNVSNEIYEILLSLSKINNRSGTI
ncbi:MAG: hypothetical protein APF84_10100 [Gracilibacter sp. BRH_c7a]|nr:MAG: hypothetical protein APF84_10100 [Gracilibacter sp. BRH_c7a]